MAQSDWETSSGLNLDGATVTVTDMRFGFNAKQGAGSTVATFTLAPEDGGEEIEQWFSCGKLEATKDGKELVGAKTPRNSTFGILVESAKDVFDGDIDALIEAVPNPRNADSWIGTTWTFGSFEQEGVMNPQTKETSTVTRFILTEYHGRDGEGAGGGAGGDEAEAEAPKPAAKTAAKKALPKKPAAKKAAAKSAQPASVSDEDWQWTLEAAKAWEDTPESFLAAMMEEDAVLADPAWQKAIVTGAAWAEAGR